MKKLLILIAEEQSAAILEPGWSWPAREWDATVCCCGNNPDVTIGEHVRSHTPDVVCWFGVNGGPLCPSTETLKWVRSKARHVLWSTDAAYPSFQQRMREWRQAGCFDFMLATDGVETDVVDWTTLWPIDPSYYTAAPQRDIRLSWAGSYAESGPDHELARKNLIDSLKGVVTVQQRKFPPIRPYNEYANFLLRSQAMLNHASCSPCEGPRMQVKERVMEAARAGCCLFEELGSPTRNWFKPGVDYFEYGSAQHVRELIDYWSDETKAYIGRNLREKAKQFSPEVFWQRVIGD